ncbi:hypothetical protein [Vibrio parahaemolyticus]|uniref:hypothetical protein n=1 Tax=Vibrio parahaemolyticus TaxID=670 RepID=UPI0008132E14|nr:hypothetical protein [Vibrio parahaemolyticus]OCP62904.1 hypothetical protein AKH04_04860 [Vibrio parahaemolyticus]
MKALFTELFSALTNLFKTFTMLFQMVFTLGKSANHVVNVIELNAESFEMEERISAHDRIARLQADIAKQAATDDEE